MTGLLSPKSSEIRHFCRMFPVVYLSHGIFHPAAFLFFSKSVFGRGLKLPKFRKPQKSVVQNASDCARFLSPSTGRIAAGVAADMSVDMPWTLP